MKTLGLVLSLLLTVFGGIPLVIEFMGAAGGYTGTEAAIGSIIALIMLSLQFIVTIVGFFSSRIAGIILMVFATITLIIALYFSSHITALLEILLFVSGWLCYAGSKAKSSIEIREVMYNSSVNNNAYNTNSNTEDHSYTLKNQYSNNDVYIPEVNLGHAKNNNIKFKAAAITLFIFGLCASLVYIQDYFSSTPKAIIQTSKIISKASLVIRNEPDVKSKQVAIIPRGKEFTLMKPKPLIQRIDNEQNSWYEVRYLNNKGWVSNVDLE